MHILTLFDCLHFSVSESISPLSASDFSIPGENLEPEISNEGISEMLNTELKKKAHVSYNYLNYDLYSII